MYLLVIVFSFHLRCGYETSRTDTLATAGTEASFRTAGFFLDNWQQKRFSIPPLKKVSKPEALSSATIHINAAQPLHKVSPYIFGNNANTFSGQMTGEPRLLENIRILQPRIIRFPGGDLSNAYFWNASNREPRPAGVPDRFYVSKGDSTSSYLWYGKNNEPWTLSLENYYKMLEETGSEGLITVNYGYARYGTSDHPVQQAAHLAAQWVRHDAGRTRYWEVGNENYGYWEAGWRIDTALNKDGQPEIITGGLYGRHFNVFADSMRKAASEIGADIKIGAQLVAKPALPSDNSAEKNWNKGYFATAKDLADFYIVHSYYTNWGENTSVQTILDAAVTETRSICDYLERSRTNGRRGPKPVAMTEWNIFARGSDQKVSHIAGVHATLALGEMLSANFGMAARWQLLGKYANGDDFATFSIGDEPDNSEKWNPRPVFFYLYYFNKLIGDRLLSASVSGNRNIRAYASKYSADGSVSIAIVNEGATSHTVSVDIVHAAHLKNYYWYILEGDGQREFSRKVFVNGYGPSGVSGGPANYLTIPANSAAVAGGIKLRLPPRGTAFLVASAF